MAIVGFGTRRKMDPRLLSVWQLVAVMIGVVGLGAAASRGLAPLLIALVLALLGVVVVVEYAKARLVVLVLLVPVVSGLSRGIPVPNLRIGELLIVGIAVLAVILRQGWARAPWSGFDVIAFTYALATLVLGAAAVMLRDDPHISMNDAGKLVTPLVFFALYRTVRALVRTETHRQLALRCILLASVPVSVVAILQFVDVGPFRVLASQLFGEVDSLLSYRSYRATGPFAHGHILGAYLFVIALLGFAFLLEAPERRPLDRWLLTLVLTLATFGILATATATPMLATIVGCIVLSARYGKLSRGVLAFCVLVVVAVTVFGPTIQGRVDQQAGSGATLAPQTVSYRYDVWAGQYFPTIRKHLLIGYGPDLPPGTIWKYTESLYVTILLRGGLVLLVVFGVLLALLYSELNRRRRSPSPRSRSPRSVPSNVLMTVIVLLVPMHLVDNYFVYPGFGHLFWILAAIALTKESDALLLTEESDTSGARGVEAG